MQHIQHIATAQLVFIVIVESSLQLALYVRIMFREGGSVFACTWNAVFGVNHVPYVEAAELHSLTNWCAFMPQLGCFVIVSASAWAAQGTACLSAHHMHSWLL